jgi:hypothetical protein
LITAASIYLQHRAGKRTEVDRNHENERTADAQLLAHLILVRLDSVHNHHCCIHHLWEVYPAAIVLL